MIALDTNILICACNRAAPESPAAAKAVGKAREDARGWGVAFPVLAEFWSVATSPAHAEPASARRVQRYWQELRQGGLQIWAPSDETGVALLAVASRHAVRGRRIYDLQIAMIALENGADEIWTHDADFLRVPGLKYFDPISHSAGR